MHRMLSLLSDAQFVRFLIFGGTATLVSFLGGYLLYGILEMSYGPAIFIGSASAIVVNFGLNYAFNFRYRGRSVLSQVITFASVALFGSVLTVVLARIFLWVSMAAISVGSDDAVLLMKAMCHVLSIGIVTLYSFFAHKYFSFNKGIVKSVADCIFSRK